MKIMAISDTHGETKKIEVPACDLLIHAGDICADAYKGLWCRHYPTLAGEWFQDVWIPWMQPMIEDGWVKQVVGVWGNHDWTSRFGRKNLPDWVRILVDEETEVGGLRIWGSPWSNTFMTWAWNKDPEVLADHYTQIPAGVDILISHQPPAGCSKIEEFTREAEWVMLDVGSTQLRDNLERIHPKVVVCGHIHSGYGVYDIAGVKVMNVACLDERYEVARGATEVVLEGVVPQCH